MHPTAPPVTIVAAVTRNGGIGLDNALLWTDPQDQRHFRTLTLGHPVVMGRKTWDSLPARFRPLPGRRNLVVTRQAHWRAEGAEAAHSLDEALALTQDASERFVIGGAELYALALPLARTLVLTEVDLERRADAFFPAFDPRPWDVVASAPLLDAHGVSFRFVTYRRPGGV
jgi:dihydrofolate reductase